MPQLDRPVLQPEAQYHYCIVRTDVSVGQMAAQLVHAAGESANGAIALGETNAVALGAKDEAELIKVGKQLTERHIVHRLVTETDGAYAGQLMAIGVCPGPRLEVLRWLPLVK